MKAERERTERPRRLRLTFAALAALSLAPAAALAADNGPLGYPCGKMPGKLPQDNTGFVIASFNWSKGYQTILDTVRKFADAVSNGGADKVEPIIARIAAATPAGTDDRTPSD